MTANIVTTIAVYKTNSQIVMDISERSTLNASCIASGKNKIAPTILNAVEIAKGDQAFDNSFPNEKKIASPITAQRMRKLPNNELKLILFVAIIPNTFIETVPKMVNKIPEILAKPNFSLRKTYAMTPITAGVQLSTIPLSTADVYCKPYSKQMLNRKIPTKLCISRTKTSFLYKVGSLLSFR